MNLIHKFESMGRFILIDVYSGAVHIVSKIVYDIVDDVPNLTDRELIGDHRGRQRNSCTYGARRTFFSGDRSRRHSLQSATCHQGHVSQCIA